MEVDNSGLAAKAHFRYMQAPSWYHFEVISDHDLWKFENEYWVSSQTLSRTRTRVIVKRNV